MMLDWHTAGSRYRCETSMYASVVTSGTRATAAQRRSRTAELLAETVSDARALPDCFGTN